MIGSVAYVAMHSCPLLQPGRGDAGGMNVYIDELAKTMARRGVDVVVFTRLSNEHTPEEYVVEPRYRVVHLPAGPMERLPIDAMPGHATAFGRGIVTWADENGKRFDVVHSHYWVSGWAGIIVKESMGAPLANSFHTLGRVKDATRRPDEPASSIMRLRTEEEVIALADCVIASTPYEFDDLLAHYRASPERLCVSPPGIDRVAFTPGDRMAARAALGIGRQPTILFVGRIQPLKGPDIAVRSLALVPDEVKTGVGRPQLIVIGGPSGPSGDDEMLGLGELADELGVADRITFLPPQPHRDLANWYRAADVLVMPSRSETFGMVAAEAQACGLPVVASRIGGLPSVVSDSEAGILVDGFEPRSFAAAITAVLDHPDFAARLGEGAVHWAERFSWSKTADRLLELYDGIGAS